MARFDLSCACSGSRDTERGRMADETPIPTPEYPAPSFPTVFADGVSNIAYGPVIVKFFLTRLEPSITVINAPVKPQPFAQVVMPLDGFLSTFVFFENLVENLVRQGTVSQEKLNNLR